MSSYILIQGYVFCCHSLPGPSLYVLEESRHLHICMCACIICCSRLLWMEWGEGSQLFDHCFHASVIVRETEKFGRAASGMLTASASDFCRPTQRCIMLVRLSRSYTSKILNCLRFFSTVLACSYISKL